MTVTLFTTRYKLNLNQPSTYILKTIKNNIILIPKSKKIINNILYKKNFKLK